MCSLYSVQCLAMPKLTFIIIFCVTIELCIKIILCSIRNSDVIFTKYTQISKNEHKNKNTTFMKNP